MRACGRCGKFAHMSCLMQRARVAVMDSSEVFSLDDYQCENCGSSVDVDGRERLAISWSQWMELANTPKDTRQYNHAMLGVAAAATQCGAYPEALSLFECCEASASIHYPAGLQAIHSLKMTCLQGLGLYDLDAARSQYESKVKEFGRSHKHAFEASVELMRVLCTADRREEAVEFGERRLRSAEQVFGRDDFLTAIIRDTFAFVLSGGPGNYSSTPPREDLLRAQALLQENRDLATRRRGKDRGKWIALTDSVLQEVIQLKLDAA